MQSRRGVGAGNSGPRYAPGQVPVELNADSQRTPDMSPCMLHRQGVTGHTTAPLSQAHPLDLTPLLVWMYLVLGFLLVFLELVGLCSSTF